jgi:hypothetical protein
MATIDPATHFPPDGGITMQSAQGPRRLTRLPLKATVPPLNHTRLALPSQYAHRSCPQHQYAPAARFQSNPPRRQNPQNVRVRKQRNPHHRTIALPRTRLARSRRWSGRMILRPGSSRSRRQRPSDHPIRSLPHLFQCFPAHNRARPHRPSRNLRLNLRRSPPLVHAVVPLAQVIVHHRPRTEPRNLASLFRPQHRTPQHSRKHRARQKLPQLHRPFPPLFRQRNIGSTGVLPARTPLRLAMPNQPKLCQSVASPLFII